MELTQSAFNLFLDMTQLTQDAPSEQLKPNQEVTASTQSRRVAQLIHYFDGHTRREVTRADLIKQIIMRPRLPHQIWVPAQNTWISWRNLPALVAAVKEELQRRRDHSDVASDEKGAQASECARATERLTSTDKTSRSLAPSSYLSIPETVFTHFEVELSDEWSAIPFLGLSDDILEGGLILLTDRVLNVGDEIQLKLTLRGKELISFEAPVCFVRCAASHEAGVAVYWPELTPLQKSVLTRFISTRTCEFLAA